MADMADLDAGGDDIVSPASSTSPNRPPEGPKEGGWAAASPKRGSRRRDNDPEPGAVDERLTMEAPPQGHDDDDDDDNADSDDDIPRITDLNEKAEEDLTLQVADAPSQQVHMTTIASLDKDLVSTMPLMQTVANYMQQHHIDLNLLTKALNSSRMISESDEPWTNLFAEVKSELQTEREAKVELEKAQETEIQDLPDMKLSN
eukprot:m.174063 g.174063  ORF g.174063 m.174063 type:complete len:203 (-) comp13780_c0_seq1:222-830(-)